MEKILKIILAILLFLCLAPLPYGYFQFVRFAAAGSFFWFAYLAYERENRSLVMLFVSLGILFQPVAKIALGRTIWNIVDVIVGILLLALVFFEPKQQENSSDPK